MAHPADGAVDEDEVISFLSRCQKYALSSARNPKEIDTNLLTALKAARFKKDQIEEWEQRIAETLDAQ